MRGMWALSTISVLAIPAIARAAAPILPGLWETTVTINTVDMPGAPPAIAARMRGHKTVSKHCATPKEVAQGPQAMLKSSSNCHFNRYSMAGGHFSSEMVCNQNGMKMVARSDGSFTPTSFTATSSSEMTGPQHMRMSMSLSSRRIGDCR